MAQTAHFLCANYKIVSSLLNILSSLGLSGCAFSDDATLEKYSIDATQGYRCKPNAVVFAQNKQHVEALLKAANEHKFPVTVRGAGTGTTGGALAAQGGVVLSLEQLTKIIEIDSVNRVAVVEPGVITGVLQTAVESVGLFYPPDPASLDRCTLGGNVAENAGGPRALKYGVTGQYVVGLEGVWANGVTFKLGGKLHKNVAGYDLIHLLVGSEGTLGVITSITLALKPKPLIQQVVGATFGSVQEALNVLEAVNRAGIEPSTAEFFDTACVEAVKKVHPGTEWPSLPSILIECDGFEDQSVSKQINLVLDLCKQFNASYTVVAATRNDQEYLWTLRRRISESLRDAYLNKLSHDIVVPLSCIPEMMEYLKSLKTDHYFGLGYGHLGDGNIHANIVQTGPCDWPTVSKTLTEAILSKTLELGGTITGEHGVGLTKKDFLSAQFSNTDLAFMKSIKRSIDPNGILNPGKIFTSINT